MVTDIGHHDPSLVGWRVGAEAAASVATSASCQNCPEDIGILAVVEAELKLREIEREIFFAYVVKRAHNPALQQRPEVFEIIGMDLAAHVFAFGMINRFVGKVGIQPTIADVLVCSDQIDLVANRLTNKPIERCGSSVFDHLADYVALARDRADHADLASTASAEMLALAPMLVALFPADKSLIDFDLTHQFWKGFILHCCPDAMAHKPRRPIITAADLAMDLKRADAFLGLAHQIDDLEPSPERVVGILEYRLCDDAEAVAVTSAAILVLADPVEGARLQRIDLGALTSRTLHAVRPAHIAEKRLAGIIRRVVALQLSERDVGLSGQRLASYDSFIHEENIAP
jgi:hypothetical protein